MHLYILFKYVHANPFSDEMKIEQLSVIILSIVVIVSVLSISVVALSYNAHNSMQKPMSSISVSGSGYASYMPEYLTVYMYINGSGSNSSTAYNNLSNIVNELNGTAKPYLVSNQSGIKSLSYSLYRYHIPNYTYMNSTKTYRYTNSSIYVASITASALVPSSNINNFIAAISNNNYVSVSNIAPYTTAAEYSALTENALNAAMINATTQARILSGNNTLYISNISSYKQYIYPIYMNSVATTYSQRYGYGNAVITLPNYTIGETVSMVFRYYS